MAKIKRTGFGQVEPNHLSAQRTGQIYAQLPAKSDIDILENGQFVKYDYAADATVGITGVVDFTGAGEWMMVFNEVKLYDGWRESYKDFAMQKKNYTEGVMTPRVIKTNVGDIFTTNAFYKNNTGGKVDIKDTDADVEDITLGAELYVGANGFLTPTKPTGYDRPVFQAVKITTMPDAQPAVKVMRIK